MKEPRLRARVDVHAEGVVVLPGDVKPAGFTHDVRRSVTFARSTGGFVFCRVPGVGDSAGGRVDWYSGVVALLRRDHANSPVFADDRYPVSGKVYRRT